jgi:hypothetical protein
LVELPDQYLDAVIKFRKTLDAETDRGVALVCADYLDGVLERLLLKTLVEDSKLTAKLFGPSDDLGTFSTRIDLSFLMGLLGPKTHRGLHLVRKIRNSFAHCSEPRGD